jgi:hypothetical protein
MKSGAAELTKRLDPGKPGRALRSVRRLLLKPRRWRLDRVLSSARLRENAVEPRSARLPPT